MTRVENKAAEADSMPERAAEGISAPLNRENRVVTVRQANMPVKRAICILLIIAVYFSICAVSGTSSAQAAAKHSYWIKVNRKAHVCLAYKKVNGSWKPIRAMYCSGGISHIKNDTTPLGTFKIKRKSKWETLYGNEYGRYAMVFYRDFLFHSVGYRYRGNKGSMVASFYNRMDRNASLGCVRLQLIDEKWLYDHCSRGTKITIYSSSKTGPMGKPQWIKVKTHKRYMWDPTDPDRRNPMYKAKAPVITVSSSKAVSVKTGSAPWNIKEGMTAKDPRTFQNLTSLVKYQVYKMDENGSYVRTPVTAGAIDTTAAAKYRIVYSCYFKYCSRKAGYKTLYLTVAD